MLKVILICLFIFSISLPIFAQEVSTAWVQRYNGSADGGDGANAIAVDGSGNVYVTGYSFGYGGEVDWATVKYDPNGNQLWVQRYGGPGQSTFNALAVDCFGNVYVTGRSEFNYCTTLKYDSQGNQVWLQRYLGPTDSSSAGTAISLDDSGNVYVTGGSRGTGTLCDLVTVKYDSQGNQVWVQRYNGPANGDDVGTAIALDGSGNVYVAGRSFNGSVPYFPDYVTVKYDQHGNQLWVQRYSYSGPFKSGSWLTGMVLDGSGNVYVTGYSEGSDTTDDWATVKYDSQGNQVWVQRYSGSVRSENRAQAIAVDCFGNVYVTGSSYWFWGSIWIDNFTTVKYDSQGNQVWVQRVADYCYPSNSGTAIAVDLLGNVYVTGRSCSQYATVKYNPNGNEVWVQRYSEPETNPYDGACAIAVDLSRNVYITGTSWGMYQDYATIKYVQPPAEWTILVYMNGDNNLEPYAIKDMNEMEMVGSSDSVNIVVQIDRIPGFYNSNPDWTDTRRYYIIKDTDPNAINSIRLDAKCPLGEKNMGDPQTLVDFVDFGIANFPARHYAVVVWDHGNGWYKKSFGDGFYKDDILFKGIGPDSTNNNDFLGVSNGEWGSAISAIKNHLGRKIDLLGFDACLMQMWEVMDITDGYADYMVGSEETENGDGWQYTQFLTALMSDPTMSAAELGKKIVDAAVNGSTQSTQSCVDLSQIFFLTSAVNKFANELLLAKRDSASLAAINDIRLQLALLQHEFWFPDNPYKHIDLYDFANRVYNHATLPDSLRSAASQVMSAINNAVTWNRRQPNYSWADGIAVYYPLNVSDYDNKYNNLSVAKNTLWDNFISGGVITGDANGDGRITVSDVVYLINYLFKGGPVPIPDPLVGDVNCDGRVTVSDVVFLINFLFKGGPPPGC